MVRVGAKEEKKPVEKPKGPPAQKHAEVSAELKKREGKDFKGIVRVASKDLEGHLSLAAAFRKIKGVGHNLAENLALATKRDLGVSPKELVGNLSEEQLGKVEAMVKDPAKHGVKPFMLNRQKDRESGEDKHLVGTDLVFTNRQDIEFEKNTRTWRGWRHSIGQKVRGQHTRTTGRTGMSVGVLKKVAKAQKAAAAMKAQETTAAAPKAAAAPVEKK